MVNGGWKKTGERLEAMGYGEKATSNE